MVDFVRDLGAAEVGDYRTISRRFEQAPDALETVRARPVKGKVVLEIVATSATREGEAQ